MMGGSSIGTEGPEWIAVEDVVFKRLGTKSEQQFTRRGRALGLIRAVAVGA